MKGRLVFLGTGGSMGVPVIGCPCSVCQSPLLPNRRSRSSALLFLENKIFLIDAGPDFRQQALRHEIRHLDGLLLTHHHFDHIGGLDDLRIYYLIQKRPLPCLLSEETMQELRMRYHYMLRPHEEGKSLAAQLDFHLLPDDFGATVFEGIKIHYTSFFQAGTKVTGFRVGSFAYVSDIREYSEDLLIGLKGIKTLVLSAIAETPTKMHFSVEEAVAFSHLIGAEKTYLTHLSHDVDYSREDLLLPHHIRLAYDGLEIAFEVEG